MMFYNYIAVVFISHFASFQYKSRLLTFPNYLIQNQILEKNEDFKKMLSENDEKISHLKSHNQNLEDKIEE